MSKDKGSKYAARLTCIYDFCSGRNMDREELSPKICLNAIVELSKLQDQSRTVGDMWRVVSDFLQGVGNKDVQEESWDNELAKKNYDMQRREINAALKLKEVYESEGSKLFETANALELHPWIFYGWMSLSTRIPWILVLAIEELEQEGNWSVKAAIDLWKEKQAIFIQRGKEKKHGFN